jgi:hypothetical protein
MNKIILYTLVAILTFVSKSLAQETFEERAKQIALQIKQINKTEKEALKIEVEVIQERLEKGEISKEEAEKQKLDAAAIRAKNIETMVADEETKLRLLIKDKVDGHLEIAEDTLKIGNNRIVIKWETSNEPKMKSVKTEKRTTSQFVFAFGLNNLVTDGDIGSLEDSDYRVWGSHFYEWGFTWNTRIFEHNNLLHAKYGFSVMYNNLRPTDNRFFVKDGNQTTLANFDQSLRESRFRNVQLVLPLHLEFDMTPKKTTADGYNSFRTHRSVRLGLGGYAGLNIKTKQILKYKADDVSAKTKEKGDFNTSTFIYGLSTYVGYKATTLYLKYDLNPLFKNNSVGQNNISLGIRFDFN